MRLVLKDSSFFEGDKDTLNVFYLLYVVVFQYFGVIGIGRVY